MRMALGCQEPDEERTREDLLGEIAELRRRLQSYETSRLGAESEAKQRGLKQTEQALRESEEQLRVLFENSPVAIIVVDPVDLRFFKFNERALALSGYSREEFERLTIVDFEANLTLDEIRAKGEELLEKGWHRFETRIRTKNGDLHELQLTGQVIHISGRPYLLQIFEDISGRKTIEGELIQAKERAEEASRAKGEFLANMSHEIRTPLTVVMASLELLLQSSISTDLKELLELANSSANRLHSVIEDILDFSRIEARRLEIHREDFDLGECLGNVIELFRMQALEKGLQLRYEIDPAVPALVHGDSDRLSQVLINLIGNAVKFTHRGGVTVRIHHRSGDLLFSVGDTGIGIAESKRDRLFQCFSQLDSSLTRKYGGTGLGLAISKALVELMGGAIRVESVEGEGSVFSFTLPMTPAALPGCKACEEVEGRPPVSSQAFCPARILLVDDDPQVRKVLSMMLLERQWEVVIADGGDQAVQRWMRGGIDLILMDLQMPDMDGLEATRIIRKNEAGTGRRVPIIAVTAHVRPEDMEKSLAAGMDGFLGKPVSVERLYALVETHLEAAAAGPQSV